MKTSELQQILKARGCYFVRHGGKHDVWYSPLTDKEVRIWRHGKEIPTGTAEKILKEAGCK